MRIALIHAVTVAIEPIEAAFRTDWPEAERMNVLDDALSADRARSETLTPALAQRIRALADYAVVAGADAVLYTCSAFGAAIEATRRALDVPVLRPNEAMFTLALGRGRRIGMLATFAPSVASMEAEFAELANACGTGATLQTVLVEPAMRALRAGDAAAHDRLLAEAAPRLSGCDCVLLAHFSTARAAPAIGAVIAAPVLSAPVAAVRLLRERLGVRARPAR
jgi:hypothetical protein